MRSMESTIDGKHVIVLYEDDWKPCHLYVRLVDFDIVRIDDEFKNAKQLSAFLASELLYGPACDFLHEHEVPYTSTLWDLNHSGPPRGR